MMDFEKISKVTSKYFDIDLLDIKRNGIEIYSNVPCNIQINQSDNPDTTAIDVVPIISSLTIHMEQYVDIQNNDYIVAKRMSKDRKILEVYTGVCGFPSVWQARKSVNMKMETLSSETEVTPPPPMNKSEITISYVDLLNNEIKPKEIKTVEKGNQVNVYPLNIDGYDIKYAYLDNELLSSTVVTILETKENHNIIFQYDKSTENEYLRILANGVYTRDDGSLAYGYHLYKKIPILSIIGENGIYTIETPIKEIEHEDNGLLELKVGTKIKLFNSNEWVRISGNPVKTSDGYKFTVEPFTPQENEASAYICNWYEVTR